MKVLKTAENDQPPLLSTDKTDYVNNEVKLITEHMPLTKERNDVDVIKERIQDRLLELGTAVQSCSDEDTLLQLDKILLAAKSLLVAMQQYKSSNLSLQTKQNVPANKKIDPQRRFLSTKKKRESVQLKADLQSQQQYQLLEPNNCFLLRKKLLLDFPFITHLMS